MNKKITLKVVVDVEYDLNDESLSCLLDMVNKKMDLCMRALVYPPTMPTDKKPAKISNLEYVVIPEEI